MSAEPVERVTHQIAVPEREEATGQISVDCVAGAAPLDAALGSAATPRRTFLIVSRQRETRDIRRLQFSLPGGGHDTVLARQLVVRVEVLISAARSSSTNLPQQGQTISVNLPDLSSFERVDERGNRLRAARRSPPDDSVWNTALSGRDTFAVILEPSDFGWLVKEALPVERDAVRIGERDYSVADLSSRVEGRRAALNR